MTDSTKGIKTIIIIGTGDSLRQCDYVADEVWGVNGAYTIIRGMPDRLKPKFRMDKLFAADTMFSNETGSLNFDVEDINKWAKEQNCEIISQNKMVLGKHKLNAKQYPFKKISEYFGTEYFTDTVCYMIAYALYIHSHLAENPNHAIRPELEYPLRLKLFGIDMITSREQKQSKPGLEFWLGIARGMGCEIEVAPGGIILQNTYPVPYGHWSKMRIKKKLIDPLGLLSGKEPTTNQADAMYKKLKKEENELSKMQK